VARFEIPFDRGDQRRGLHRGDKVIEETLLGAFEGPGVRRTWLGGSASRFRP
jgi:hypothetical protein